MKVLLEFPTMIRGGLIHPAMLQVAVLTMAEALGQVILVEIKIHLLLCGVDLTILTIILDGEMTLEENLEVPPQ
jgi:hypothetical protein